MLNKDHQMQFLMQIKSEFSPNLLIHIGESLKGRLRSFYLYEFWKAYVVIVFAYNENLEL